MDEDFMKSCEISEDTKKTIIHIMSHLIEKLKVPSPFRENFQVMQIGFLLSELMHIVFDYDKWMEKIPFLKFDEDWEIKPLPNFRGAITRFRVKKGNREVSVFLDCYAVLGATFCPYWEVFDMIDETFRIEMNNTDELISTIREFLSHTPKEN